MKWLLALVLLAGCGTSPACRQLSVISFPTPPKVVERTVYVTLPPQHTALISTYASTLPKQAAIAQSGSIPAIQTLTTLNAEARKSLVPLRKRGHKATPDEVQRAIVATGAVKAFVDAPHAVVPPPAPFIIPPAKPIILQHITVKKVPVQ